MRLSLGGVKMNKIRCSLLMLMMFIGLTGCSFGDSDTNSIYLNDKGKVKGTIIEDFSESYYDEAELKALIDQSISDYNQNGEQVKVNKFKVSNSVAKLVTEYNTTEDYADFNDVEFFYGTVREAVDAGYLFDIEFVSADDKNTVAGSTIKSLENYHVVVFEEKITLKLDKKILFASQNASIDSKKEVTLSEESEGLAYVIFE